MVAGVLSTGWGLAFAYSQGPIIEAMKAQGAGDFPAGIAVWALGLCGAADRQHRLSALSIDAEPVLAKAIAITPRRFVWPCSMACCFIPSPLCKGMLMLGSLGASVGWGVG